MCESRISDGADVCQWKGERTHPHTPSLSLRSVLVARRRMHVSSKRNSYSQGPSFVSVSKRKSRYTVFFEGAL